MPGEASPVPQVKLPAVQTRVPPPPPPVRVQQSSPAVPQDPASRPVHAPAAQVPPMLVQALPAATQRYAPPPPPPPGTQQPPLSQTEPGQQVSPGPPQVAPSTPGFVSNLTNWSVVTSFLMG